MLGIPSSYPSRQTSESQSLLIIILLAFWDVDASVRSGGGKLSIEGGGGAHFLTNRCKFLNVWCYLTINIYLFGCIIHDCTNILIGIFLFSLYRVIIHLAAASIIQYSVLGNIHFQYNKVALMTTIILFVVPICLYDIKCQLCLKEFS